MDKTIKNKEEREQPQKNLWINKIEKIKTIKGYELKDGNLSYEVEAWDKNDQMLFVPPLSSAAVRKIDETKIALFLMDCLARGYQE